MQVVFWGFFCIQKLICHKIKYIPSMVDTTTVMGQKPFSTKIFSCMVI